MGMRVRLGPFSVSSRGRVGVNVGPVGIYGGGRRRRPSKGRGGGNGGGFGGVIVMMVAAGAIISALSPAKGGGHAHASTPSQSALLREHAIGVCQHITGGHTSFSRLDLGPGLPALTAQTTQRSTTCAR